VYVISLGSFERRHGKSGTEFLGASFEVWGPRYARRRFYSSLFLNVEKEGTRKRWEVMLEAVGCSEEFELGSAAEDNAAEGDRNIARNLKGKPFVAEIEHEKSGEYTNINLKSIWFRSRWTDEHKRIIAERGNPEDSFQGEFADDALDSPPDSDLIPF
jgi:hypothetical protein